MTVGFDEHIVGCLLGAKGESSLKIVIAVVAAFFWSAAGQSVAAELPFKPKGELSGIATVVDGDGVRIAGVEVRLQGIAAPEDNGERVEPGGKEATAALRALAEGQFVLCYLDGTTTRKRPVGVCFAGDVELGEAMVRGGFARGCPRYSKSRYSQVEEEAAEKGAKLAALYPLPKYCLD